MHRSCFRAARRAACRALPWQPTSRPASHAPQQRPALPRAGPPRTQGHHLHHGAAAVTVQQLLLSNLVGQRRQLAVDEGVLLWVGAARE